MKKITIKKTESRLPTTGTPRQRKRRRLNQRRFEAAFMQYHDSLIVQFIRHHGEGRREDGSPKKKIRIT